MERSRLIAERDFHDRQAAERALTLAREPARLCVYDAEYLEHESWVRPALERLGPVAGRAVLDFGCGHGIMAVVLARRGARVVGFDLSTGYITEARARGRVNAVQIDFMSADGERLPFADHSFDCIWGNAVLHHLSLPRAASELQRVLKPAGRAVFCEPWGDNRILEWARSWDRRKDRTDDERPLRSSDLAVFQDKFSTVEIEGFQLFGLAARRGVGWLRRLDRALLMRAPRLNRLCRYVVMTLAP